MKSNFSRISIFILILTVITAFYYGFGLRNEVINHFNQDEWTNQVNFQSYDDFPKEVINMLLLIEDQSFFNHSGIEGLSHELTLALHHIGIAQHLLVNGADDLFLLGVVITRDEFQRSFALLRETLDPEQRGRTEGHGQADVCVTPWSFRSGGLERVRYKAQSNVSECCVT